MGEMKHTKKLIELILRPDFKEPFEYHALIVYERLVSLAELASKEIAEQEARERGEQGVRRVE